METKSFLKIDNTDIILIDYEPNQGKIIISNYDKSFSYFWGGMGGNIKEFLLKISDEYFIDKIHPSIYGKISPKKTMKEVRKWWKNESGINWYEHKEFQKELRQKFNDIENNISSEDNFIYQMNNLDKYLPFYNIKNKWDEEDLENRIKNLTSEPWNFIVHDEHYEHIWLKKLFKKLKKELKKL